jgi:hypothetical protein
MQGETKMLRFIEYVFSLNDDDNIKFEELESEKLNIKTGDGFVAIVDNNTNEVTLKKIDLDAFEHIEVDA